MKVQKVKFADNLFGIRKKTFFGKYKFLTLYLNKRIWVDLTSPNIKQCHASESYVDQYLIIIKDNGTVINEEKI